MVLNKQLLNKATQYIQLSQQKDLLEMSMNHELEVVRLKYKQPLQLLKDRVKDLEKCLKTLVTTNKEKVLLDNKKSIMINSLHMGFRKSSQIIIPSDLKENIISFLEKEHQECLDIKKTIKKSTLSSWSTEKLNSIGIEKKNKDSFFIEMKSEVA